MFGEPLDGNFDHFVVLVQGRCLGKQPNMAAVPALKNLRMAFDVEANQVVVCAFSRLQFVALSEAKHQHFRRSDFFEVNHRSQIATCWRRPLNGSQGPALIGITGILAMLGNPIAYVEMAPLATDSAVAKRKN